MAEKKWKKGNSIAWNEVKNQSAKFQIFGYLPNSFRKTQLNQILVGIKKQIKNQDTQLSKLCQGTESVNSQQVKYFKDFNPNMCHWIFIK